MRFLLIFNACGSLVLSADLASRHFFWHRKHNGLILFYQVDKKKQTSKTTTRVKLAKNKTRQEGSKLAKITVVPVSFRTVFQSFINKKDDRNYTNSGKPKMILTQCETNDFPSCTVKY